MYSVAKVNLNVWIVKYSVVFFKNKYYHDLGYHCFDMHFPISLLKFQKYATIYKVYHKGYSSNAYTEVPILKLYT